MDCMILILQSPSSSKQNKHIFLFCFEPLYFIDCRAHCEDAWTISIVWLWDLSNKISLNVWISLHLMGHATWLGSRAHQIVESYDVHYLCQQVIKQFTGGNNCKLKFVYMYSCSIHTLTFLRCLFCNCFIRIVLTYYFS
jgi:hypothetical protein